MLGFFIAVLGVAVILQVGETLYRRKMLAGESVRKFVHSFTGIFVAFWPWLMPRYVITLVAGLMIIVVILAKHFRTFRIFRSVRRSSYGELSYGLGIGAAALLFTDHYVFAFSILVMALADGAAALVGRKYAKKKAFKIFGYKKSLVGSMAFFFVTLALILSYWLMFSTQLFQETMPLSMVISASVAISTILTVSELLAVHGVDNFILPIITGLLLSALG